MTEMEEDCIYDIAEMTANTIRHYPSYEAKVNAFWKKYFASCEMRTPETGLEMPHEEDLTYTYHPNADEYNSRYGW
jgi:hypothetical protein